MWFGKKRENKKKPGPKFWPVPSIKIIQMYSPVFTIQQVLLPCGVRFIMKETPDTLFLFLHHKSNPLVFNHVLCTVLFSPIMFQGTSHLWGVTGDRFRKRTVRWYLNSPDPTGSNCWSVECDCHYWNLRNLADVISRSKLFYFNTKSWLTCVNFFHEKYLF